jgi:hypothetical protein
MSDISKTSTMPGFDSTTFEDPGYFEEAGEDGTLPRLIHAALAIYLLPALALVLVIGGGVLLISASARGVAGSYRWLQGLRPRRLGAFSPDMNSVVAAPTPRRVNPPMAGRIDRQPCATPNRLGRRRGAERLN